MKKIVIPYDFSDEADHAIDAAIQFSQKEESLLHLIHVVEIPSSYLGLFPEFGSLGIESIYSDDVLSTVKEKVDKRVRDLNYLGIKATSTVMHGKPFESIQKTIVSEEADLIIMGSRGATGLKEMFIGSNTERVIRYSKAPVLTVKKKINLSEMSDMVFATDFVSDNALKFAKYVQKLLGLKIRLLKVYNTNDWAYTTRTAREKTEEFGIENGLHDYSVHVIDSPFVTDGILRFAHEKKTDMIVMGTHGFKGLGHLIAGSKAEGVANHSQIPIFTIHK